MGIFSAQLVTWFGLVFAAIAFISVVSKKADTHADPKVKDDAALYLLEIRQDGINKYWIPNFNEIFDSIFGKKHFRPRCFFLSSIISLGSFVALFYILNTKPLVFDQLSLILLMGVAVNIPGDYLSLLQTRWLIKANLPLMIKLTLDAVFTLIITILSMWAYKMYLKPEGNITEFIFTVALSLVRPEFTRHFS